MAETERELWELVLQLRKQQRDGPRLWSNSRLLCLECREVYNPDRWTTQWGVDPVCPRCECRQYAYFDQRAIADIAEWLTEYLAFHGGVQLESRIRHAAPRCPWEIVEWVGARLGFYDLESRQRWRLPAGYPLHD